MKAALQTEGALRSAQLANVALLSPMDSLQRARPLRAWRKDQREWMQSFFTRLSDDWHRAWSLSCAPTRQDGAEGLSHELRNDQDFLQHDGNNGARTEAVCAWLYSVSLVELKGWQQSLHHGAMTQAQMGVPLVALYASMFGEEALQSGTALAGHSVALELCSAAWADWWQRLAANLAAPHDQPASHSKRHPSWSGSLQVHLPWCGGTFVLELNFEQVMDLLAAHAPDLLSTAKAEAAITAPKKVSLLSALGNQTMPLRAMLTGVELSLRQIQSLRVGDIVPLQHRLDEPTLLETPDAFVVCHGWLGQKSGQVAVEMASRPATSHKS
ncbi:MAG: hypothetical protein RIS44_3055 [Pseudomonadota bacterium]